MIDQTHAAREHLHQMVELANLLISESINQTDPVLPIKRTISKEQFVEQYNHHSTELCSILDDLHDSEDVPSIDHEVEKSRKDLVILVKTLQEKIDKLNDLRFWMDNMISDDSTKE
ncbi:hypothetical protein M9Y10_009608 [Tritrichomonas musculus]|uniref:Mediator of RNA polymerase II transcription subunit 21 n=1 Tax=Tritrichomonas musculus TaxID=1915356 RepID=A0ABR2INU4_9EUKA